MASQSSQDSIFTKILKGEIPGVKVWEDEKIFVLMDKFPSVYGQTLVITKAQIDYLFDLPDDLYAHLWLAAKKTARAMDRALKPRRTCAVVEGFEVPHVHIRLYPVPEGQPLTIRHGAEVADEVLENVAEKIRSHLS